MDCYIFIKIYEGIETDLHGSLHMWVKYESRFLFKFTFFKKQRQMLYRNRSCIQGKLCFLWGQAI